MSGTENGVRSRVFSDPELDESPAELQEISDLDTEVCFGAFVLLAVLSEVGKVRDSEVSAESMFKELKSGEFESFYLPLSALAARYELTDLHKVQIELDRSEFTPEQQTFVWQWVQQEYSFVGLKDEHEDAQEGSAP